MLTRSLPTSDLQICCEYSGKNWLNEDGIQGPKWLPHDSHFQSLGKLFSVLPVLQSRYRCILPYMCWGVTCHNFSITGEAIFSLSCIYYIYLDTDVFCHICVEESCHDFSITGETIFSLSSPYYSLNIDLFCRMHSALTMFLSAPNQRASQ